MRRTVRLCGGGSRYTVHRVYCSAVALCGGIRSVRIATVGRSLRHRGTAEAFAVGEGEERGSALSDLRGMCGRATTDVPACGSCTWPFCTPHKRYFSAGIAGVFHFTSSAARAAIGGAGRRPECCRRRAGRVCADPAIIHRLLAARERAPSPLRVSFFPLASLVRGEEGNNARPSHAILCLLFAKGPCRR